MKKKLISFVLIGVTIFTLAGCNSNPKTDASNDTAVSDQKDKDSGIVDGKFKSAEAMMNNKEFRKKVEEGLPEDTTITAKGNTLTYTFKQKEGVKVTDEIKKSMEDNLIEKEPELKEGLQSTIELINTDKMKVVYQYVNADGSEIYTHKIDIIKDDK